MRMCQLCLFERNDDTATRCRQCGGDMAPLDDDDDDDAADSAWFHYLKIPKVGTLELVPGKAFRLGREGRNELVLRGASADLIATFFWSDDYDEATIKEHGAKEVIKVDNVRISGVRTLKGGEELEVGPVRMQYLKRATPVEDAIDAGKVTPKPGKPDPRRSFATPAAGGRSSRDALDPNARQLDTQVEVGIRRPGARAALEPNQRGQVGPRPAAPSPSGAARGGKVGGAPAEIALALEKVKASGTLRVKSPAGRGWIQVVAGQPIYAAFAGLSGRAALEAILRLPRGSCQMVRGAPGRGQGERLAVSFSAILKPGATRPGPPAARPGRPPAWGGGARRPPPRR